MMRMRPASPVSALSDMPSAARATGICAACGMQMADSLRRLGSIRCHDCRDVDAPIRARLPSETTHPRELAHRSAAGLNVALLWFESTGRIAVRVIDSRSGEEFEMTVEAGDALTAFHHPFSYMTPRRTRAARALGQHPGAVEAA
jgi:hypothetical protein